jgi:hypothetical protein
VDSPPHLRKQPLLRDTRRARYDAGANCHRI